MVMGRWIVYQSERFPLSIFVPLALLFTLPMAVFTATILDAPFNVSGYFCASLVALTFLALTLIGFEHKEYKIDMVRHQDKPVARGLVSLRELRFVALYFFIAATVATCFVSFHLLIPLLLCLVYYALFLCSFFMKDYLTQNVMLSLFLTSFLSVFADGFMVLTQCYDAALTPNFPMVILFSLSRVLAVFAVLLAYQKKLTMVSKSKFVKPVIMLSALFLSSVLLIFSLLGLSRVEGPNYILGAAFLCAAVTVLLSNTANRLFKVERFGVTLFAVTVTVLPCIAARLVG